MKRLLILALLLLTASTAKATDIYFAATSAGSNNGTNCANAYAYNDGTHGWNVAGNWVAGNTLHICGTITATGGTNNFIFAQASGSSGNPITIKFETGAVLQAPWWGDVIHLAGATYITVDGGTNGLIQATANGTLLANQQDVGIGVNTGGGSNVIVKNLTIANLYVHACTLPVSNCTDEKGGNTNGILASGGSTLSFTNNTIHDVKWAISYNMHGSSTSNITVSNNTLYNTDHGVFTTDGSSGTGLVMNGLYVFGNTEHDLGNWDDAADNFHHDCNHLDLSQTGTSATGVFVYNNYCYGNMGVNYNSSAYFSSAFNSYTAYVFNNVFVLGPGSGGNGCGAICALAGVTISNYNNTLLGQNTASNVAVNYYKNGGNITENNATQTFYEMIAHGPTPASFQTVDYNNYWNVGSGGWQQVGPPFSAWQAFGWDVHGSYANPLLSATFIPNTGSPLIGKGLNLYTLAGCASPVTPGLGALCNDAGGNARPVSAAWDMGAYNFVSAGGPVLSFSPNPAAFGNQNINTTSSPIVVTVSNLGSTTETYSSIAVSPSVFVNGNTGLAGQCPASGTILAAAHCTVTLTFTPTAVQSYSGTLTVTGTVTGSDPLTGAGTNAISIPAVPTGVTTSSSGSTVNVAWTASTGTPTGYFVSRSAVSGGPYTQIANVPIASGTVYADSGLANRTYYYVVAAYNSAGTSANSSQASATVSLSAAVNFTPVAMPFGAVVVGATSGILDITVKNVGTAPLVLASSNAVTTSAPDFSVDGSTTCTNSLSVAVNATCIIAGTVAPSAPGFEQGTICMVSNSPTSPDCAVMSVTGTAPVSISPASLSFPNTFINKTSQSQTVTYINNSGVTVTFTSVALSGGDSTQFDIPSSGCSGTLANGASCTVSVDFKPTSVGSKASSLVFTDSASGSPHSVALTGTAKTHHILKIGAVI